MAKRTRRDFGTIRQLPSGRYQASYLGPDGERHNAPQTFDTRTDASTWLAAKQTDIAREAWQRPEPPRKAAPTFGDYSAAWLASRTWLRASTRSRYGRHLRDELIPAFGAKRLDEITPVDVREWYASFGDGRPAVRAYAYRVLRGVLKSAINDDRIIPGPLPCTVKHGGDYERVSETVPATPEQIEVIACAMRAEWSAMVLLAAWCQLRFGEISELRRKDVDLDAGLVRVRRAVNRVDGQMVTGPPKSRAGKRDVAIPPHILPRIAAHLDAHVGPGRDALLFTSAGGLQLYPGMIGREYTSAREAAGRPDLRFHDLRHTGATMAAQAGATTAELMARLGHASPRAAMIYQHALRERDAAIAGALSELAEARNVVPLRRARKAKADTAGMERRLAEAEAELAQLRARLGRDREEPGRAGG